MWKKIIVPDGEGYWSIFETRQRVHIGICALCRNEEDGLKDEQDGMIIFFHVPNDRNTLLKGPLKKNEKKR
jgi:hypothetical protein